MRRSSLITALALGALILAAGCTDDNTRPIKGGGPIGTGTPPGSDATTKKDGATGDGPATEAGPGDASPSEASVDAAADSAVEGGSPISCTIDCDCPQEQACGVGGVCVKELQPTYCCNKPGCVATNLCTDYADNPGVCGTTGFCTTQCDCPQGLTCNASLCAITPTQTYCCTKAGCPTGQPCLDGSGNPGTCP